VFAVCAFPVHVWSIINVLRELPAWALRLSAWELTGVISYTLAFALVESALLLVGLLGLAVVLPAAILRRKFIALSSVLVLIHTGWAIVLQYNFEAIRSWGFQKLALLGLLYLITLGVPYLVVHRYERVERFLRVAVERLSVLSYLYISLDILGVLIVLMRNISRSV
jgi:hypothetical protein